MRSQIRLSLAVMAASFIVVAGLLVANGRSSFGLTLGGVGLAVTAGYGWWSLRRGRHTPWTSASEQIRAGHAVVFWKPGCPFCERLLRAVGKDSRITWVNVWHDDEAQRRVCQLNQGNEYTPTALVGDRVLRNPSAAELTAALG